MRRHFAQVFWGLLLVLLDLSINGFDLLPDGLGYLIIAVGCGGLSALSARFSTARTLCFVLAVFWLIWLIGFVSQSELAIIYGPAAPVVDCVMIWQLLGGISEFAREQHRPDLAKRAETCRFAYPAIAVGLLLVLASSGSSEVAPFAAISGVAVIVVMTMILHLIHCVKRDLAT